MTQPAETVHCVHWCFDELVPFTEKDYERLSSRLREPGPNARFILRSSDGYWERKRADKDDSTTGNPGSEDS